MSDPEVQIERDGPLAVVTLNDPATRNALSSPVIKALVGFLECANRDPALGCIVITGAGDAFSSGGNVRDMQDGDDPMFHGPPFDMMEGYRNAIQKIPLAFAKLDVPTIAAVNGAAVGAGCDLACMCDIRLAAPQAQFAESYLRVGLVPGDGGAWYLPRVIGMPRALEMSLTCDLIGAEQAERWGLVSRIVPEDNLLSESLKVARKIASFPPLSARLNRRLIRNAAEMSLQSSLELSASYQAIVQHTSDHREAINALLQKRPPLFLGR
ncbi:acyl-CoA hydratase [Mesorhizobium plurifarium]|uniref:Acyl-CoA hydratase n=1 Tax=Mesorhizobium plurifarium TaxID=69974 RepID=A0A090GKG2_MESPL|nr:acyl-CoA hydratase [Mesorhizobium plurifarium]